MSTQITQRASLFRRLAALVYDSLIAVALCFIYGFIVLAIQVNILGVTLAPGEKASIGHWGFVGMIMVVAVFNIGFWYKAGQTLGMRTWRLMLVDADDPTKTPSLKQCLMRFTVAPISLFAAGLGYWWSLVDKAGKTLHDHLSNTQVIMLEKPKK